MIITVNVHDAKKERPSTSGAYVTISYHGYYNQKPSLTSLDYSKKHDAFNAHDHENKPAHEMDVDYWFDIPDVANMTVPVGNKG